MSNEEVFYEKLNAIPEMPSDLYGMVDRKIRQRENGIRAIVGIAAALIVATGAFGVMEVRQSMYSAMHQEVTDELNEVHEYLNAADVEEYLTMYASIEFE